PLHCVAFSPDGRRILTGSQTGVARLWDVTMRKPLGPPLAHPMDITAVTFRADGQAVMTGTLDGTVRTWDLVGSPGPIPKGLKWRAGGNIDAMAFHPDGHALLTGGDSKATRFWSARTGVPLSAPLAHATSVVSAAISPDGKIAITACWRM